MEYEIKYNNHYAREHSYMVNCSKYQQATTKSKLLNTTCNIPPQRRGPVSQPCRADQHPEMLPRTVPSVKKGIHGRQPASWRAAQHSR